MDVTRSHSADLPPAELDAARTLAFDAFAGELEEDDWEHALGGLHVLVHDAAELVGHAAVIQRRLVHAGRALRCGYVEAVAVRADRRRRGVGGLLMAEVERVLHAAYDLGALGTSDEGRALYLGRGWLTWRGPLAALTPRGTVPSIEEAGYVLVLALGVALDLDSELVCDWRDGDVW